MQKIRFITREPSYACFSVCVCCFPIPRINIFSPLHTFFPSPDLWFFCSISLLPSLFITAIIITMFVIVITISLHTILYIMCNCTKDIQKTNQKQINRDRQIPQGKIMANLSFNLRRLLGIDFFGNLPRTNNPYLLQSRDTLLRNRFHLMRSRFLVAKRK